MTSKGQVTIPKRMRDRFGLQPGSEIEFAIGRDGDLLVKAKKNHVNKAPSEGRFDALVGTLDLGMTTDEFMRFIRGDPEE
jgi:AbrB family looped-hinge helix DNA binding protein